MSEILVNKLTGTSTADTVTITHSSDKTMTLQAGVPMTLFMLNLIGSTSMSVPDGALSSRCLNISSGVDGGTGVASGNITSNHASTDIIFGAGQVKTNNTMCLDRSVTTTSLLRTDMRDADSNVSSDLQGCMQAWGELA
jgi:hypothetical protein